MLLSLLAAATPLSEPQPMAEERFQQWLLESDLQQLELGCGSLSGIAAASSDSSMGRG